MFAALGGAAGIGSLLGGAGSFLGALGGFNQKSSNNGWQNVANVWAADRAFDQQVALMKHQAEINSPANQMKRYKEAGLNPNLIYGQISSGNVSMPSGVNAPIIRDYNKSDRKYSKLDAFSGVLKSISDAMDNLNTAKAQKDYLEAKTATEKAKANRLNSQADLKSTKNIIDDVANFNNNSYSKDWANLENFKEFKKNSSRLKEIEKELQEFGSIPWYRFDLTMKKGGGFRYAGLLKEQKDLIKRNHILTKSRDSSSRISSIPFYNRRSVNSVINGEI